LLNQMYGLGIEIKPDTTVVCNRSLDSSRFRKETGFSPPTWPEMIQAMKTDHLPYDEWKV